MAVELALVGRPDLDRGRGKIAAQVAHAAVTAALRNIGSADFDGWLRDGQPKVVLKVTSGAQLRDVAERAVAAGLPVELIQDARRTQVAPGTLTCCAVGAAAEYRIHAGTGELSLL